MRAWILVALAVFAVPSPVLAQSNDACVEMEWRPSARDLLAVGVTYDLPHPATVPMPTATAQARPLLVAMAAHLRAFREAPLSRAPATTLALREMALHGRHVAAIDALAVRAWALCDASTTVQALLLQAEAHDLAAARLVRFPALVPFRPAERGGVRRVAARERAAQTIARLAALRDVLDRERNVIRCPLRTPLADPCDSRRQVRWDEEVSAHRMIAVVLYATAIHVAREYFVVSDGAWRAASRLQEEDYRPLREQALQYQGYFLAQPGEFDPRPPGAVVMETGVVSGARLVSRETSRSP